MLFPKSRAGGYLTALSAARKADRYHEATQGAQTLHLAGFGAPRDQLALAILVVNNLRTSKGLQIFGGGRGIQDKWRIEQLLQCVLTASNCSDPKAHCVVMLENSYLSGEPQRTSIHIDMRGDDTDDRYGLWKVGVRPFPCRLLYQRGFKFQHGHPSTEAQQIEAAAIREGCDWCPHLRRGNKLLTG